MNSSGKEINLRIAVISDLHFVSGDMSGRTSWLTIGKSGELDHELWDDLLELQKKEDLQCDLLLCPGDITTYADPIGLTYAWEKIIDLGKKMNATLVGAATGNHDVQSRPKDTTDIIEIIESNTDLFENLKKLDPPYPIFIPTKNSSTDNHLNRIHYFGADYLMIDEFENFRVVIFNSCARHTTEVKEYERGRVADSSLRWIENQLETIQKSDEKVNIFLCHHHPIQHQQTNGRKYDFMDNGTELLNVLCRYGDWLVIHGHKHQARLTYAPSTRSRTPVIFAAGTLAAHTHLEPGFRNQFYIIDVSYQVERPKKFRGTISVWNWNQGYKWKVAECFGDGLFSGTGFGEKNIDEIYQKIVDLLDLEMSIDWQQLKTKIEELNYITTDDLLDLKKILEDDDIEVLIRDDVITSVSRRIA